MQKRDVSVVITDLDNTLYDWVEVWYRSFSAMLDTVLAAAQQRGVSRDQFVREIRAVHQRHGTSEYAFLLEELPSLQAAFPGEDLVSRFDEAIHGYRKARKEHLKLYPGVMATLRTLKDSGVLIVAYTESMAFYTNYRMRRLELDGVIDYLYSPKDHDLPFAMEPEQVRKYPSEHYRLKFTEHRHTPEGELKPNPRVLLDIVQDIGADPHSCIYIGDSLMKDVAMAKDAGVVDVYALYGKAQASALRRHPATTDRPALTGFLVSAPANETGGPGRPPAQWRDVRKDQRNSEATSTTPTIPK